MKQVTLDEIIQQALNLMKDLGISKSNLIRSNNRCPPSAEVQQTSIECIAFSWCSGSLCEDIYL